MNNNITGASILIVEDDENLRFALQDNLVDEGYLVQVAETGDETMIAISLQRFDLIILDIMLPDTDGYTLCGKLKKDNHDSMILMLTARTLEDDLVKGFEAGADDYLAKPYRLRELLVRIKALLRRKETALIDIQTFAGYRMDIDSRKLTDPEGGDIELTRTEFDLLFCFLKFKNQALTRDQILDEVWGQDIIIDGRTVDNFVSSLKKKMGWSGESAFRFTTIRGVGYRMEVDG